MSRARKWASVQLGLGLALTALTLTAVYAPGIDRTVEHTITITTEVTP